MYAPRGAWVKVTANSKPRPKNVINVQHVIKIYQALPLLRFSRHYYCVGRGSAWFQATTVTDVGLAQSLSDVNPGGHGKGI